MKIINTQGSRIDISTAVFEFMGEKDYGAHGYNPIPLSLCEQVLDDIDLDLDRLEVDIYNFSERLMMYDSTRKSLTGADYNGRAYATHLVIGARNEKDIKLGGVNGIGGLIIHEIGHAIMYKAMNCTYANHMQIPLFQEYIKLRGIPSTFTDKSLWEKRPAEIFAEDFRYLFGDAYMKEEAFLPFAHVGPPKEEIKQFMLNIMLKIGVKEKMEKTVVLKIGSQTYYVNKVKKKSDVAAFLKNDRTFVPLRLIAEAFNFEIDWDGDLGIVTIKNALIDKTEKIGLVFE